MCIANSMSIKVSACNAHSMVDQQDDDYIPCFDPSRHIAHMTDPVSGRTGTYN
jgi:hypothetical protein